MTTRSSVPSLMTFSSLARKLDIPLPHASRQLSQGILQPDYRIGERFFFLEDRIDEIQLEIFNNLSTRK